MKKLLVIILIAAILLPSINVEAKTKVTSPTISVSYNKNNGSWYFQFNHSNKKAKIYYRANDDINFKTTTVGKKVKMTEGGGVRYRAKVGKNYSGYTTVSYKTLITKQTDKDAKMLAKKIVGKAKTDFEKLVLISKYCVKNWRYDDPNTYTAEGMSQFYYMHMLYDNVGVCGDMAYTYQKLLNAVGVKATYVTDRTAKKYGYHYRPSHAWTNVKIDGQWQVLDITSAICSGINKLQVDIYDTYTEIPETSTLDLNNGRLWAKTDIGLIPVFPYLEEDAESTLVWDKNTIDCSYTEDGSNYNIHLEYNENTGYWDMYETIDGVTNKI